jgi:hypothetical protein
MRLGEGQNKKGGDMPLDSAPDVRLPLDTQWSPVSIVASQPLWSRTTQNELIELTKLPNDWDSYGSPPVPTEVISVALGVLATMSKAGMARPTVLPVPGGGVQFEWASPTSGLEVEIRPDRSIEFLIVDREDQMSEGSIDRQVESEALFCLSNWFIQEKKSVEDLFRVNAHSY